MEQEGVVTAGDERIVTAGKEKSQSHGQPGHSKDSGHRGSAQGKYVLAGNDADAVQQEQERETDGEYAKGHLHEEVGYVCTDAAGDVVRSGLSAFYEEEVVVRMEIKRGDGDEHQQGKRK